MRHKNNGLRKRCSCKPRDWPKCAHGWHLNFKWKPVQRPGGPADGHWRLSLDREVGRHIDSKSEACAEADRIRTAIRNGNFRPAPTPIPEPSMAFRAFAEIWKEHRGCHLASGGDDVYRLATICAFVLPGTEPGAKFGDRSLDTITTEHVEAFRESRKAKGLSSSALNHDLKLLRKMFNWAIRKEYLVQTPFKIGTEPSILLEREIPRNKRFQTADDEQRLLDAANPHLRAVITAMLDTACRPGEILSLQWREVSLERRELTILASKEKTGRERVIPISQRLMATLEMRRLDPAGREWPLNAYVFGKSLGRPTKSVQGAWTKARDAAKLGNFQLRDLRHEAASRFDEAGMPIVYVSSFLGHSNLSTTSRYLNINRRGMHLAMQKMDDNRTSKSKDEQEAKPTAGTDAVAQPLHTTDPLALAVVLTASLATSSKTTVQ